MGELIDMRIPFHLRRLQADVRRAEQDYDQFHEKFERRLLSRHAAGSPASIILPPKPEED